MATNRHNTDDFNSLPIEELNKIKVLSLYDFIFENKDKIQKENYGVGLISRTFGLKKVEIATYLKPVCNLSQKLGTDEVCDILFNIKERMQDEDIKKKKPTIQEIQYAHYLKDERLNDIVFESVNDSSINNHESKALDNKTDKEKIKDDDEDIPSSYPVEKPIESSSQKPKNAEEFLVNVNEKQDFFLPEGEEIVEEEEDKFLLNIKEELTENDVEYEKEEQLNFATKSFSKEKKPIFKKVLFGVGVSALIVGSLYGTYAVVLGGNASLDNQGVSLQNFDTNNQAVIIPPIEAPNKNVKPALQIQIPNQRNETITKFPMVQEEEIKKVETPTAIDRQSEKQIAVYENPVDSSNFNAKKTEDIEKTLQVIMAKLNALEENKKSETKIVTTNSSNNTSNTEIYTPVAKPAPIIEFKNVSDFERKFKEFKFDGKTFQYKSVTVNEGDVLGNIKVEYIIPDAQIRIWDIKEGYPFVKVIK